MLEKSSPTFPWGHPSAVLCPCVGMQPCLQPCVDGGLSSGKWDEVPGTGSSLEGKGTTCKTCLG